MESEIDELKQEVEELKEMTAETNRLVRKMRRSQWYHTLFQIVWWLTVVGITGAAYYYYVQPYVDKVVHAYNTEQNFQSQVQDWFSKLGPDKAQE